MKHYFLLAVGIFLLAAAGHAQKVITLDLQSAVENGDYELDPECGNWVETYNAAENVLSFNDGMFNFSHNRGLRDGNGGGGGMGYWDGFTICNSGDTTDYGETGDSEGWIAHQWGCMAGGGLNGDFQAEQEAPYLVAYWGYFLESDDWHSCQVDFDGNLHRVKGVYICNHPWPYYGNEHGDGFASAFGEDGAYFRLIAHGMANGEDTGSTASLTLAEFPDEETGLVQSADWQWFDLSTLGKVDAVYFTLGTTDEDQLYGANTAVYFCLDKLQIFESEDTAAPERPDGLHTVGIGQDSIAIVWNKVDNAEKYLVRLNNKQVGETTDTAFVFRGLDAYADYAIAVIAVNDSGESDAVSISVMTTDETAPTAPQNIVVRDITPHSATISWEASVDNVSVERYRVWMNDILEARPRTNVYTLSGLEPETEYFVEIEAVDQCGNISEKASVRFITAEVINAINGVEQNSGDAKAIIRNPDGTIAHSVLPGHIYIVNGKKILIKSNNPLNY